MHMESHAVRRFEQGIVLDVIADDLPVRVYIAICPPDPEAVAAFVPPEQFDHGASLHVAAVGTPGEAAQTVEDILFNMDPHDAAAFLCADRECWLATAESFGYVSDASPLK